MPNGVWILIHTPQVTICLMYTPRQYALAGKYMKSLGILVKFIQRYILFFLGNF